MSEPRMVPTARSVEDTASSSRLGSPFWRDLPSFFSSTFRSTVSSRRKSYTSPGSKWVLASVPT